LCDAGLLKDLRFPHMDKVIYDNNVSAHHHFLDEDSGRILDLDDTHVEFKAKLSDTYEVHDVDILVRGRLKK
jgi:Fe2+ or Zn2+ uptake regulation protein